MTTVSDKIYSRLKLAAILLAALVATGCISAKSNHETAAIAEPAPAVPATPAELLVPVTPAVPATPAAPATPTVDVPSKLPTHWVVVAGEHLWGIAGVEEVFNASERWPLLYKHNLEQIKDADLIYPGQVLDIPRTASQGEIDAAVNHAKNRGAWAVGPIENSDLQYLNNAY